MIRFWQSFSIQKFPTALLLALVMSVSLFNSAAAQPLIPSAPNLAAKSWILMDAVTGSVLSERNADDAIPPASMTKMMVSYIVANELAQNNLSMEEELLVSTNAWRKGGAATGGSTMFLKEKSKVSVEDLLYGLIVQSGNDAAIALAEHIGGSESAFAEMMNQQAKILGMTNSNFLNSTGWPEDGHVSSARDMAILANAIIRDYPEHYAIYSVRKFKYNGIEQRNRNSLLWQDSSVDGVKTGSTSEAGYCLVASAERDDTRLTSVIMGAESPNRRASESKKILAWGFRYFNTSTLYNNTDILKTEKLWQGEQDMLNIGISEDLKLTLPRRSKNGVKVELAINKYIEAPIKKGQQVGQFQVFLNDEMLHEGNLVSLESVEQSDFFSRLWDSLVYFFINIMK